jgi:hypothetical protein
VLLPEQKLRKMAPSSGIGRSTRKESNYIASMTSISAPPAAVSMLRHAYERTMQAIPESDFI